jgi:murein DD-endopeptidase MepM/ murein hydrolase activator NlpD
MVPRTDVPQTDVPRTDGRGWRKGSLVKLLLAGMGFLGAIVLSVGTGHVAALETSSAAIATGTAWSGSSFPVENFQEYTSPFGYRRSPDGSASQEFHRGLDMAAPQGSYIRNWWGGKVLQVSDGTACGTYIVIQSGQWEHLYCHMEGHVETQNGQRYLVDRSGGVQIAEGQDVAAGTRIGRVGMTGRTTGPHLHWGLKYGGKSVDPALVLRAMYAEQTKSGAVSQR